MANACYRIMKLPVNIKKKQSSMPIYSAVGLIMLCIALFCLFIPFIPTFANAMSKNMQVVYMTIGGVCTLFFAFVTSYSVFNIISPPVGITISDKGIYEYTVAECGAGFIPKEAIVSLKTFGKDKKQYLGINIAPEFVKDLGEGIAAKREITNNVEAGIPAVIIRQSDIYITVGKLLKLIIEAYGTDNKQVPLPDKAASEAINSETVDVVAKETAPSVTTTPETLELAIKPKADVTTSTVISDDTVIDTAVPSKSETPTSKKKDDDTIQIPPPPNVIKTVDELLAQLNISPKKPSGGTQESNEDK